MSVDFVMVLRVLEGHTAAKIHRWIEGAWATQDFDAGTYFDAEAVDVDSIQSLSRVLSELEGDQQRFVIRGQLIGGDRRARRVLRRYLYEGAAFEPTDHFFVALDVDGAPAPVGFDLSAPDALACAARWAIEKCLPPAFRGATCHARWSSSAGVKPSTQLRLQLWFWLDRPACDRGLKAWLRPYRYVDAALFQPVQPHYTAIATFEGADDPLEGRRSGLIHGTTDVVVLPSDVTDLATWSEQERIRQRKLDAQRRERLLALRVGQLRSAEQDERDAFARRQLSRAIDRIANAVEGSPESGRHANLRAQAYYMGTLVAAGLLSYGTAEAELESAGFAVLPENRHGEVRKTVRSGLERGQAHPFDTTKLAESASTYDDFRARRRERIAAALWGAR